MENIGTYWDRNPKTNKQPHMNSGSKPLTTEDIAALREVARVSPRFSAFDAIAPTRIKFKMHRSPAHRQASIEESSIAWSSLIVAGLKKSGDCTHYTKHVPMISYHFEAVHSAGPTKQMAQYKAVIMQEESAEKVVSCWIGAFTAEA